MEELENQFTQTNARKACHFDNRSICEWIGSTFAPEGHNPTNEPRAHEDDVACVERTAVEQSGIGLHQWNGCDCSQSGLVQKPRLEQIHSMFNLCDLITDHITQHRVLEVPVNVERCVFHRSVFPFASEA